MDQPLFGETRRRDKVFNIALAFVTAIFVGLTCMMAILSSILLGHKKCRRLYMKDHTFCVYGVDIALCLIIILLLIPQILVAYWYRRGELEPKFRYMLIYNAIVTMLLCVCANLYFLQVGFSGVPDNPSPPSTTSSP